jgi:hypothetical protein
MPRRVWIIWLMLALLPLRGWAVATMQMPDGPVESAGAEMRPAQAPAQLDAPCHDAAQQDAGGHACGLCDLCHSAVTVAPQAGASAPALPTEAPAPAIVRDTGRCAVDGLERPPRTFLA